MLIVFELLDIGSKSEMWDIVALEDKQEMLKMIQQYKTALTSVTMFHFSLLNTLEHKPSL